MLRKLLLPLLVLALVIGLGIGGGWLWLRLGLPKTSGSVDAPGLGQAVEIVHDYRGVPHIFAKTGLDATYALGFVHAQDRLWQMEAMRRQTSGRLAEIIGSRGLANDRLMRVLGIRRAAEAQYAILAAPVKATVDAYVAGVNAGIEARRGALPLEFLAVGATPEPWRPADALLWGKAMAMTLSGNWQDELLRARLLQKLTPQQVDELWPERPESAPRQRADARPWNGMALDKLAAALPPAPAEPRGASNAWAAVTGTGEDRKALLANDPHLGLTVPILWYLARIESPDLTIAGATVPGVPFVLLGHNKDVAWGITATQSDLQDLFVEKPEGDGYASPDGPKPFETRTEVIKVRGGDDVTLTVRATRHGPVISDVLGERAVAAAGGEGRVLALAATFLQPDDRTPEAFYGMNRAKDWTEFAAALEKFHAPQQNILYADTKANIGFYAPGRVPVRKSGKGWLPAPGWTGEADWVGFVPFDRLPRVFNPPEGRLVSANQRIVSAEYPYFLGADFAPGYRADRIHTLLGQERAQSLDRFDMIQRDDVSPMAKELLPLMMADLAPAEDHLQKILLKLKEWPGSMTRRQPEPLLFSAWLRELNRLVYADELGDLFDTYFGLRPSFIAWALKTDSVWCDDVTTPEKETCKSLVLKALKTAFGTLAKTRPNVHFTRWHWGTEHVARLTNPVLSGLPIVKDWVDLAIDTDGGNYTINRGGFRVSDAKAPFAHVHGPGLRALYDLGRLETSRFMIATGQSGNPLSPHYGDLLRDWRDGRYLRLTLHRRMLAEIGDGTLTLKPAEKKP